MICALAPHARAAANGTPLWTNNYNGTGNSNDYVIAMAVDTIGNVFVTGFSYSSSSSNDYATVAYSGSGVPIWTNRYSGPGIGDDRAQAIAVDGSGNVCVTGIVRNSMGNFDYATIKYSGTGVPLWTNIYNGPANGDDVAFGIAVDRTGNVFVTGTSVASGNPFTDYATVAYSGTGILLWTERYNGQATGPAQANAIATDRNGNVFVTGYSSQINHYPYNHDYATIKYSGDGIPVWTNYYNGENNGDDEARAIAVDVSGDVFVAGHSYISGDLPYFTNEYAIIKYSGAGVPLWTNHYSIPGMSVPTGSRFDIAVDRSGNVFLTGFIGTVAYSSAGALLWTNYYFGNAIAVDASGNVFVTGAGTTGYSGAGVPLWTNRHFNGNLSDVAVDLSGNVLVAGQFFGPNGTNDYTTIKYAGMFTLAQPMVEDGQFSFRFDADSNVTYAVEFCDFLNSSDWMTLTNISAQPVATNFSFTNAINNESRFYRVRTP